MMSHELAIRVDNLGKRYTIGARPATNSFREMLANSATATLRRLKAAVQRKQPEEDCRTFWALKEVSFEVKQGEVVGIIGRNGAGKSTLLKLLTQITPPTTGRIEAYGRVASLLEVGTGFHPELTGRENIFMNGAILGMTRREIARKFDEIVAFAEVGKFLDTPAKRYSSGMYVRLAFAVAAHLEPDILLIDEVLAVGDAPFQQRCLGKMGEVARDGRTVILISHNMEAIHSLCTRSLILHQGEMVLQASTPIAVAQYYRMTFGGEHQVHLAAREDRSGNGLARVTDICLLDHDRHPVGSVGAGDACYLEFAYRAQSSLDHLAIAWNVRDRFGQPLIRASSADTCQDAGPFSAHGKLRCFIPRLPLIPDRYAISIELQVNNSVVDYIRDAYVLMIEGGDFFQTGRMSHHSPVLLDHTWQVIE